MRHKRFIEKRKKTFFHMTREEFMHSIYPIFAGVPTAILILYFFDFGTIYKDVLHHLLSPIITGVVSGSVLYALGLKR